MSPEIIDQILRIGRAEEPLEACGVVTPNSEVTRLPNLSLHPTSSFEIASEDLVNVIETYVNRTGVNFEELGPEHFIIWHTHPGGVVGPSAGDMRERLPGFQYVVVTLPNGEAVQF